MSLIIKMESIQSSEHLAKGIRYIMQEWKTEGKVYSNSGVTPDEILDTFLLTKENHPSHGVREGYHYKFSFSKDEKISKEDALCFIQEWTEHYLGDEFDSVMSVHHDREHTHMHLIFNSVKRTGGKYRYEKGDWENIIKPLTNELCEKYHTGNLREKDKNLDYSPAKNLRSIVEQDMEKCMSESRSYQDFKKRMVNQYHYSLREGVSKIHGVYLSLIPPGKAKAVRTYNLTEGFMPADIERKILERRGRKTDEFGMTDTGSKRQSMEKKTFDLICRRGNSYSKGFPSSYVPYQNLSVYQKHFVRRMLEARRLYRRTGTTLRMHEQSIHAIHDMVKEASLIYHYRIRSQEDIAFVLLALQKEEAITKSKLAAGSGERMEYEKQKLEEKRRTIQSLKKIEKKKENAKTHTNERKEVTHG